MLFLSLSLSVCLCVCVSVSLCLCVRACVRVYGWAATCISHTTYICDIILYIGYRLQSFFSNVVLCMLILQIDGNRRKYC